MMTSTLRKKTTHREFDTTFSLKTFRHYLYESSHLYAVQPLFHPKWISILHLTHTRMEQPNFESIYSPTKSWYYIFL